MASNATKAMLRTYLKTKVDEALLDYVAKNANNILYITEEQFCQKACVTELQALSFFLAFGVDSFIAFKYILRKSLYYEVTELGIVKRPLSSLADEALHCELRNLAEMISTLDFEKVTLLAQELWSAPSVTILCFGAARSLGFNLNHILKMMFRIPSNLIVLNGRGDSCDLDGLDPSSLILAFGFARYSRHQVMVMKMLRQRGFHVVSITDSPESPFVSLSDYHFILPVSSFDFNDAYGAGTLFINILAISVGTQREDALFSRLHEYDIEAQEGNMFR